jgi:hypothetical protein
MLTIPRQVMSRPKSGPLYQNLIKIMEASYGHGYTASIRCAHFSSGKLSMLEVLKPGTNQVETHHAPDYTPLIHCNTTVHFID